MPVVRIDGDHITDWDSFHDVFAARFGFPPFYGRNLNAWIDCMSYLDEPDSLMTRIDCTPSDPVVLQIDNVDRLPDDIYAAIVDCTAFVNWRRMEQGGSAILMLAYNRTV